MYFITSSLPGLPPTGLWAPCGQDHSELVSWNPALHLSMLNKWFIIHSVHPSPTFIIQVISQLKILGRSVTAGCKFDREIWSNELSPVLNLWKKLNQVSSRTFFLCIFFFLHILFFLEFYLQIVHVDKYVGKFWHWCALIVCSILEKDGGNNSNRRRPAQEVVSSVWFVLSW